MNTAKEERRKYSRVRDGVRAIYKVMGVEGEYDLAVLNLSGGGMCLPLSQKMKKGTLLELNLNMPPEKEPFFALAEVVWQSPDPISKEGKAYYETGIEFLRLGLKDKMRIIRYIYKRLKEKKKGDGSIFSR